MTRTNNDMNERKARLANADESNWCKLPGIAGRYDPVFAFEWAPHVVIVYGTPNKDPGWGWSIRPHRDSPASDLLTNWSFTLAEAKPYLNSKRGLAPVTY